MALEKAKLIPKDGGLPTIEFMFNPTEVTFEKKVDVTSNSGARGEPSGQTKIGFATTHPYKLTIHKVLFDTYETGQDVVKQYIAPFQKATQFVDSSTKKRTPLYTFVWGSNTHLRSCFIEGLTYKLTMFLPNGTPVRAMIDSLTLREADEPKHANPTAASSPSPQARRQDTRQNRQKKRSTPSQ